MCTRLDGAAGAGRVNGLNAAKSFSPARKPRPTR